MCHLQTARPRYQFHRKPPNLCFQIHSSDISAMLPQECYSQYLHVYMTAKSVFVWDFVCLFVCFPCPWFPWAQVLILIRKMWSMGVKGICDNVNCLAI